MFIFARSLITNLTCPGDSSLYVEWAQPEQFYHGVDRSENTDQDQSGASLMMGNV